VSHAFYSRVLLPLTEAAVWAVPSVLIIAMIHEIWRTLHARSAGGAPSVVAQRRRESRLLLSGAALGAVAGHLPVTTTLEARFGMLVVLPSLGAATALGISGLLAPAGEGARRVATLDSRSLRTYVSPWAARLLWGACALTVALTVVRQVLPAEAPFPAAVVARLRGRPTLAPTRWLYVLTMLAAAAIAAIAWLAAIAVIRRSRPAADAVGLEVQERLRRDGVGRLLRWTTGALLLLNAALMMPFPEKMQGVVLGDIQLVQRLTDLLIVACVVGGIGLVAGGHLPNRSPGRRALS